MRGLAAGSLTAAGDAARDAAGRLVAPGTADQAVLLDVASSSDSEMPEPRIPGMVGRTGSALSLAAGVAGKAKGVAAGAAHEVAGAAGRAKDVAAGAAQEVAGAAGRAKDVAKDVAVGAAHEVAGAAGKAKDMAAGAAGELATKARNMAMDSQQRAANGLRRLKDTLEAWVKQKLLKQAERMVDKLPGLAKELAEDPDMPRCISKGKDRIIDSVWPDVRTEILWEVAVLLDKAAAQPEDQEPGCDCFRAFFRYHMYPYDRSFWGRMRDPWYLLFLVIPLVPLFCVCPIWFAFVFLVIDKSDEFQLVQFILAFKGMAFISQGVIRALVGFAIFMGCVTARADPHNHDCATKGPGTSGEMWPTTVGFVFQSCLVWAAFILLRCSKTKGRSALKGQVAVRQEGMSVVKGGYIVYFLWYDLLAFLICSALVVFTVATRPEPKYDDWPVDHAVFGAQVLYGILSMPFFLFTVPVLQRLLTHCLPTAYDRKGACRKPIFPKRKESQRVELVSEAEVDDLYSQIKGILHLPL